MKLALIHIYFQQKVVKINILISRSICKMTYISLIQPIFSRLRKQFLFLLEKVRCQIPITHRKKEKDLTTLNMPNAFTNEQKMGKNSNLRMKTL